MSPKSRGETTEAMILAALTRSGKIVLIPWGDNQRYDMVVDDRGTFSRVQCKTGRIRNGSIRFNLTSSVGRMSRQRKGYQGEIEYFGVYCPDNDSCYLIPAADMPGIECSLRFAVRTREERSVKGYKTG